MPRLDFEKQMARQLKDRDLKPAEGSWEKLQGRLELEEKKSTARFWWIGIAATIVGAFILFNFFGSGPTIENTPAVVDKSETQIKNSEQNNSLEQLAVEEPEDPSETVPLRRGVPLPNVTRETNPVEINEVAGSEPAKKVHPETGIPEVEENKIAVSLENSEDIDISDAEINGLLEKAMAEVSEEMGGETKVTDAEIDALMSRARLAVQQEQALNATATVSADQLLTEVETELEHSFRAQVFEIIKDGLRKTKNAVANIND